MFEKGFIDLLYLFSEDVRAEHGLEPILGKFILFTGVVVL
jgi:hypothetical protein